MDKKEKGRYQKQSQHEKLLCGTDTNQWSSFYKKNSKTELKYKVGQQVRVFGYSDDPVDGIIISVGPYSLVFEYMKDFSGREYAERVTCEPGGPRLQILE